MSDDMREAFEPAWLDFVNRHFNHGCTTTDKGFMREMFEMGAEWQSQKTQGEPVAWTVARKGEGVSRLGQVYYLRSSAQRHCDSYPDDSLRIVPLYSRPTAPAAVPEADRETIALAAGHLGDWLDAHECDCEMGHICGRPNVERTRQSLLDMLGEAGNQ